MAAVRREAPTDPAGRSPTSASRSSAPSTASPSPAASSSRSTATSSSRPSGPASPTPTPASASSRAGASRCCSARPSASGGPGSCAATGNFLDAETALAWGLVNHVVAARGAAAVLPAAGGRHRVERPGRRAPHHCRPIARASLLTGATRGRSKPRSARVDGQRSAALRRRVADAADDVMARGRGQVR